MSVFPRREIEEVLQIMVREPSLNSLFVEGNFDKDVAEIYLGTIGISETISVYSIDAIAVPDEVLRKYSLGCGSNKNRVVALALEISAAGLAVDGRAICVADADCDRVLESMIETPTLKYTDFTCLEMYALSQQNLSRFMRVSCKLNDEEVSAFLGVASVILPSKFLLRCCSQKLNLNLRLPDSSAGLSNARDLRTFEFEKYFSATLHANNLHGRREEIFEVCNQLMEIFDADLRHKSQGHDAVDLLFLYLRKKGSLSLSEDSAREYGPRLLWQALISDEIGNYELFKMVSKLSNR